MSYVDGGYYSQSSEIFLNNFVNEDRLFFNKLILVSCFGTILIFILMIIFSKNVIKVNRKYY